MPLRQVLPSPRYVLCAFFFLARLSLLPIFSISPSSPVLYLSPSLINPSLFILPLPFSPPLPSPILFSHITQLCVYFYPLVWYSPSFRPISTLFVRSSFGLRSYPLLPSTFRISLPSVVPITQSNTNAQQPSNNHTCSLHAYSGRTLGTTYTRCASSPIRSCSSRTEA